MSDSPELAPFQQAAVRQIVARFRDSQGSQRFLLADEVGLGKTIVARGVIDELAKRRRSGLTVLYLSSNAEIAEQNRAKLTDSGGIAVGRVTELAWQRKAVGLGVHMYAFTPGTSLGGGTGTAKERRLILFLLGLLYGKDVNRRSWRLFFRCGVSQDRWLRDTEPRCLQPEFLFKTQQSFQRELSGALNATVGEPRSIIARITAAVEEYDANDVKKRSERNHLIREFRAILQRVTLKNLKADLIILDEVQRFKDVIDESENPAHISSELFKMRASVLILSATPYKVLKQDFEVRDQGTDHHQDFFRTLEFLFGKDKTAPSRVKKDLTTLGEGLRTMDLGAARNEEMVTLKRRVERALKLVMCRTERTWYFQEGRDSVIEKTDGADLPTRDELCEFFDLHKGLSEHLHGVGLVTDFWKSAPSLLTFMDASYALVKRLKKEKARVPRRLLSHASDPGLPQRNLRMRMLLRHTLGDAATRAPHLWTRPSYTYYRDEVYGDDAPRKLLVFSGWRFVPKTIAVVASNAAALRLRVGKGDRRQPLRFTDKSAFHIFDVCFPSWALASIISPRNQPEGEQSQSSARDVINAAVLTMRKALLAAGVQIGSTGPDQIWKAIMRLEARLGFAPHARGALREWRDPEDATGRSMWQHREKLQAWLLDETSIIRISEADLRHIALIAVASPGVALLRSLRGIFAPADVESAAPQVLNVCFGELRSYFNRPTVQQAIRTHSPRSVHRRRRKRTRLRFAESTLYYSLDHHLQAVLDEHAFLLKHAGDCATVARVIAHYQSIWSLGSGSRRTNTPGGRGARVNMGLDGESSRTHFALAFGDDAGSAVGPEGDDDKRLRRSEIRQAFNSPFWPFVLATTSVGQEGLDFHLYCRDVLHWNLPSNPVDLEQREGRINRRDCLAVRHSIAADWPLTSLGMHREAENANPWKVVFERLENDRSIQKYKHGLYPHWIYECRNPDQTVRVTRHASLYDASRDAQKYKKLKTGLALYRLAFGQANQEHLLGDLEQKLEALAPEKRVRAQQRLASYMLNLSPIAASDARQFAHTEAIDLLSNRDDRNLQELLLDVERLAIQHAEELHTGAAAIAHLLQFVHSAMEGSRPRNSRHLRKAVTALAYLRNPYDEIFDRRAAGGFDDDIEFLMAASHSLPS